MGAVHAVFGCASHSYMCYVSYTCRTLPTHVQRGCMDMCIGTLGCMDMSVGTFPSQRGSFKAKYYMYTGMHYTTQKLTHSVIVMYSYTRLYTPSVHTSTHCTFEGLVNNFLHLATKHGTGRTAQGLFKLTTFTKFRECDLLWAKGKGASPTGHRCFSMPK